MMHKQQHRHGGPRKGAGRPPSQQKMRRRPIGMLESDWDQARKLATREGVSVDEIMRRLIRSAENA